LVRWGRVVLWLVLLIPAALYLVQVLVGQAHLADLLHTTGELSARLMISAMALTALRLAFPRVRWLAWLRGHRRDLGVAAFVYAVLHTVFYLGDMQTLANVLAELGAVGIWTGWLALGLFIPLAATSNAYSVAWLGGRWYSIHWLVYPAAVLILVHWMTIHSNVVLAWVHFVPLIILEVYRVFYILRKKQQPAS
tara:strand:- start:3954 stop:4535 length:582 start_codon:yes stop_codon:yes gene_type:complete